MVDDARHFWIAVTGTCCNVILFGPYMQGDAIDERETIVRSFADRRVSPVFASVSRASAEANAEYYLSQL